MCKTFHQLPDAGGVLDQNFRVMLLFSAINTAESERELKEEAERNRKEAAAHARNRA